VDWTETLLKDLTDAPGVPGQEDEVARVMERYLKPVAEITYDRLGSLIAKKKGAKESPKILIAGHMDEVGFMVKDVTKDGYIKFLPLGGWWGHVALAQRMKICTKKGPVTGVTGAKPPHILPEEERKKVLDIKDMFIDVGVTPDFDVRKKLGVTPGDSIVPDSPFTVMSNKRMYLAKALDNRFGCAGVVDVLTRFSKTPHPNTLYGVGSVQEEVGCRGAGTAANTIGPDAAIILDVGIALDTPGMEPDRRERMGGGVTILAYDSGMIPSKRLMDLTISTCEKEKIKYHLTALDRGTTDGAKVHVSHSGVPTIALGAPTRYIHSHQAMMLRDDYDAVIKLVTSLVKKLDAKTVSGLYK
jgi:endoglucanase